MKFRYLCWLISLMGLTALGAKAQNLSKADAAYKRQAYQEAVNLYLKAFEQQDSGDVSVTLVNVADCYLRLHQYQSAEKWLKQVIERGFGESIMKYHYGYVLKISQNYTKAKEMFQTYANEVSDDPRGELLAASCDFAREEIRKPPVYNAIRTTGVNTERSEHSPIFYKAGIAFTGSEPVDSDWKRYKKKKKKKDLYTGFPYSNIYFTRPRDSVNLSPPVLLSEYLIGKMNDEHFTKDSINKIGAMGRLMEQTSKNPPRAGEKIRNDRIYKLYVSKYDSIDVIPEIWGLNIRWKWRADQTRERWTEMKYYPHNDDPGFKKFVLQNPAMSPDGKFMIFASDASNGNEGTNNYNGDNGFDLFRSDYDSASGVWSEPVSLGKPVNTPGNEMYPYIAADGTLYFSSDVHPGFGGLDIFKATKSGDNYDNVTNLGININSSSDDFGICFDRNMQRGYLSTGRNGDKTVEDIYFFYKIPPPPPPQKEKYVVDGRTMEKICDSLGLNEWNCRVVGTLDGVKVSYTGGNEVISGPGGTFRYEFDEAKTVDFKGVKEGYFTERVSVFLSKNMMPVTIEMEKINLFPAEPGSGQQHTTNRRLPNIYFDYDSASIRPDQIARMDSISMVLIDNPGLVIEIGSHADERGGNRYNDKLSARRSNSIYKYLVDKGINPDRMLEMGYGKRRPVFKNVSRRDPQAEYKHQMNRRTEFKVLALSGSAESFRPKGKRGR